MLHNKKSYGFCHKENIEIEMNGKTLPATFICSEEYKQDQAFSLYYSLRTPEPTAEEISDWKQYHEKFEQIHSYDFQKIKDKYKVEFLDREDYEPYPENDW
jgi:hypothetical protein